ncbi:hypothetical protein PM082_023767 [Marasmius tenuissimus]|nr:hypothetical protein PM082_023767 [Marasmius tenuissimus]
MGKTTHVGLLTHQPASRRLPETSTTLSTFIACVGTHWNVLNPSFGNPEVDHLGHHCAMLVVSRENNPLGT